MSSRGVGWRRFAGCTGLCDPAPDIWMVIQELFVFIGMRPYRARGVRFRIHLQVATLASKAQN